MTDFVGGGGPLGSAHDFSRRDFSRCLRAEVVGNRRGQKKHHAFPAGVFFRMPSADVVGIGGDKKTPRIFRTADQSTRPASASSSRWRSPGVLICFRLGPMPGDATSSDQVLAVRGK